MSARLKLRPDRNLASFRSVPGRGVRGHVFVGTGRALDVLEIVLGVRVEAAFLRWEQFSFQCGISCSHGR